MRTFKKVAIPNRGEIAVRIIKTLKEMGITSSLLHSLEDQNSLAYRLADETLCIGSSQIENVYMNVTSIIEGVRSLGAEALHPGIGFLSESSDLAQACLDNKITFIGPQVSHLQLFEDKIQALKHAESIGIPTLPYMTFDSQIDEGSIVKKALTLGFPLMIKLTHGGGGRGLQKIQNEKELLEKIKWIQRIGSNVFGSSTVFIEKYAENVRHIEVQILGDSTGHIHLLFERDCSIQRNHQKIIEESPSILEDDLKNKLFESAQKLAQSVGYQNAGTVEFLVRGQEFYFIEMNTRLQVEHPITEMRTGVDLVRAQILTSMKQKAWTNPLTARGFALECRVYCEDPQTHQSVCGNLGSVKWFDLPGSRLDMGYESFDSIPSHYDTLIGKIITLGETRVQACQKMTGLLKNSWIFGAPTNIDELILILSHPDYIENKINTEFIKKITYQERREDFLSPSEKDMIQKYTGQMEDPASSTFNPWFHQWP